LLVVDAYTYYRSRDDVGVATSLDKARGFAHASSSCDDVTGKNKLRSV